MEFESIMQNEVIQKEGQKHNDCLTMQDIKKQGNKIFSRVIGIKKMRIGLQWEPSHWVVT